MPVPLLAAALAAVLTLSACGGGDPAPEPSQDTTSPGSSYPYVKRPSGLFWDSGVFGHDVEKVNDFTKERGHAIDVLGVSPTRGSWSDTMSDWWLSDETIPKGFTGTLNVSLQLFPEDGSMKAAADGDYNGDFKKIGQMIAKKYPTAYVRPGWEFNIPNWKWKATPENVDEFKEAFRQASKSLKEGGPKLRIVWNPNEGKGGSLPDASTAWPGDDVVDIVGLDAYDWSPPYDEKGWQEHRTKDQGWDYWGNFARQHGKKFALPEWGVIPGGDDSGGDNPSYINYVMQWMVDNRDIMAFETYFDETDDYCKCALSQNPKAKAAYLDWMPRITQQVPAGASTSATAAPAASGTTRARVGTATPSRPATSAKPRSRATKTDTPES